MECFTTLRSRVIPLPSRDVDTDQIIPAQYLTSTSRSGYGENLFRRLREADPNFPLNDPRYQGGQILLTDENFGCGSSREHAVWALLGAGFRAVVGKGFADIFSGNSAKNGLLLVTLPHDLVDRLFSQAESGELEIEIDLPSQQVRLPDREIFEFACDPFRKHCMLNGLDDIDYLLSRADAIREYFSIRDKQRTYSTTASQQPSPDGK